MIAKDKIDRLVGSNANVIDAEGNKIGSLGELYLDDRTDEPSWATVKTGLFGMSESFVPLDNATIEGGDLRVPYTKDQIKDAPRVDPEGHLEEAEEDRLYRHYGLAAGNAGNADYSGTGRHAGTGTAGTTRTAGTTDIADGETSRETAGRRGMDHDTSRAGADDAMTRSEERLRVGTESQEVGKVRLRKYVVTENVTRTVPVQREEVRLEREPITDANHGEALSGPDISEAEHEVTLHAEKPVVDKEAVPVERVRLEKDTVTDQETVSADVRKEEVEADGEATVHERR
ncbi:DUF2382 domain-containing protein [Arthrobacter sp.]|uniref:DUF2382 domain-containing protein n=1 Tax=Arthrobacter sp. TaxID=1667 RepID=UPI0033994C58